MNKIDVEKEIKKLWHDINDSAAERHEALALVEKMEARIRALYVRVKERNEALAQIAKMEARADQGTRRGASR